MSEIPVYKTDNFVSSGELSVKLVLKEVNDWLPPVVRVLSVILKS